MNYPLAKDQWASCFADVAIASSPQAVLLKNIVSKNLNSVLFGILFFSFKIKFWYLLLGQLGNTSFAQPKISPVWVFITFFARGLLLPCLVKLIFSLVDLKTGLLYLGLLFPLLTIFKLFLCFSLNSLPLRELLILILVSEEMTLPLPLTEFRMLILYLSFLA